MWALAAKRFASLPYSNGHDTRYEAVKAEIRGLYGKDTINAETKGRLKALAVNRGGYGKGPNGKGPNGKGYGKYGKGKEVGKEAGKEAEQRRRSREGSILKEAITYTMINRGDHFGEEVRRRIMCDTASYYTRYIPLYTFIAVYIPICTRYTCIYTIYTPYIHHIYT